MTANGTYRNFLDLTDFEGDELRAILDTSRKIKFSEFLMTEQSMMKLENPMSPNVRNPLRCR